MSRRFAFVVLGLVALIAVHPLVVHGCSCGHDFDFHLLNWLEAARQFRHGTLHLQWAETPAWNAGEPRFVFYPPLSWTLGGVLTLLAAVFAKLFHIAPETAFAGTPIVYTWMVLFAAGVTLFRVAERYVSRSAALLAGACYSTNAYALFTAYERTAYAELLATVLLPMLFAVFLPAARTSHETTQEKLHPNVALLGVLVALLWLTNAPAAVMGCYTVALLAAFRVGGMLLKGHHLPALGAFALRTAAGVLLGLGLAGYFLFPAIAERPWVQLRMAILPGMRPEDNTLFHHTGDVAHDVVLHAASLVATIVIAGTALALSTLLPRSRARESASGDSRADAPSPIDLRWLSVTLALTAAVVEFMLTPLADPLWRHLPELAFLQFPWRLLAVAAVVLSLSVALALGRSSMTPRAATGLAILLSLVASVPAYRAFRQSCDAEDTPRARFVHFGMLQGADAGSEPTDEYTPATADNDALADANPPYRLLSSSESVDASPSPGVVDGAAPRALALHLDRPMLLVLNLRDYPAWLVTRNGVVMREHVARTDGLLALRLPAGETHLAIRYQTTKPERAGQLTSIVAACILFFLWRRGRPARAARRTW